MKLAVRTPDEALRTSVRDFQEAVGCRFIIVEFPRDYDPALAERLRKTFLSELLEKPPGEIHWKKTENGKPYLENSDLRFSVSHSDSYWAFCYARDHEIGIDLEAWRDHARLSKVARRIFQPQENESWSKLSSPEEQIRQMLTLWTRKEAYIKAKGSLLFREISRFDAAGANPEVDLWTDGVDGSFVISCARLGEPQAHGEIS